LPLFTLKGHLERDFFAGGRAPSVESPPAFWVIPQELDGLRTRRDSVRRIEPAAAATTATHSLATRYFRVEKADVRLVVRDLGLGQVIWRRLISDKAEPRFTDGDLEDFFRGFEAFEKGSLRWYLRPISAAQRAELKRLGFRPTSCTEKLGQCFKRPRSQGEDR
jgi:hypothetical protein